MEWLTSGMRRDVCVLLYAEERRAQQLKSALEAHYDRRVKPDRFYGALDALESTGHVEKRVSGLEDVYSLTAGGRAGVENQHEWMSDRISDREPAVADEPAAGDETAADDELAADDETAPDRGSTSDGG